MLNPSNLIVLAAAAGIASAAPAAVDSGAGSFSVNQVRNPHFKAHGPSALAKAYLKYGKALPKDLENAIANYTLSKRATGSATTTPEANDLEYLTPVSIGTPAQVLNLDFDSGSSDLWVFSSELSSSSRGSHSIYTASSSSTSKKLSGATWSITYGDGSSSSGDVYTDKVTVGGLTVASQAVEAAQKVSSQFVSDTDNDGLLGLAFSSINTVKPTKQKTWFDNVKSSLDSPLWTADLKHNKAGKYNFGYIDSAAYTGSITYTSVDSSDGFWSFTSSGYAIGTAAFKSSSFSGIADTGTTLALLPDAIVSAYYKSFGATYSSSAGGYLFPCSTTPPNFTFGVGSARIVIPGSYINYAVYSGSQCYGGIQSDDGIGFSIFGDVALKAAFVVFDSTPKLGWASKTL